MVLDQLHPSSFVETNNGESSPSPFFSESCFGPRNIRNQPSREQSGVLLLDKYIPETDPELSVDFNLPFRNSIRQVDMLKIMYNKLDPNQQKVINDRILTITDNKVNLADSDSDNNSIQNSLRALNQPLNQTVKFVNYEPIKIFLIVICAIILFFIIYKVFN